MDWIQELYDEDEKPLDRLVEGYSNTSIFRKIAFVGDSLSSGEFETREDGKRICHDFFEYSWGQFIARNNSITALNFSEGGITARDYIESFADKNDFWNKEKACPAYVIALGVNDIVGGANMYEGTIDDIDPVDFNNNKKTFLGYYAQIISRYKQISPEAKFFLMTAPLRVTLGKPDRFERLNKTVRDLAEYFDNTYLIDLDKYGPAYDEKFEEKFFLYGHMSPSGYLLTAKIVDSYIDYIIRHNPEDFKNVAFINNDIK